MRDKVEEPLKKVKQIKNILISLSPEAKVSLQPLIHSLIIQNGRVFYATTGTKAALDQLYNINQSNIKLAVKLSEKKIEGEGVLISTLIKEKIVDLVINIPNGKSGAENTDGQIIRKLAKDCSIPRIINLAKARKYLIGLITK